MLFDFDEKSYIINGERQFLISGDFHYFRVPKDDWTRRMDLFVKGGGNCISTYVPWLVHEPNEGQILFDDCPERALTDFMEEVKRHGLSLILRPGPYTYSEFINSGLPTWLVENHREVLAENIKGEKFFRESVSYLHPTFLDRVKKWYAAFSKVIYPYLAKNGGPVVMIQLDNEFIGAQEWHGSIDYNRETMGFGTENGRYPSFLKRKYAAISELNKAHGCTYASFADVHPGNETGSKIGRARRIKDYHDFYCETIDEYALILKGFLEENGIDCTVCHNAAGANFIPMLKDLNTKLGKNFVLGNDNYYALNMTWAQNNPTPQYFMRILFGADLLKALGNAPMVFELPGGSASQLPPILKEDLTTCYMANLAAGYKGINYYVYTGGKNVKGTGLFSDSYDFCAFISADGEVRDTHKAFEEFNAVLRRNEWLCSSDRFASVQIGFEWQTLRGNAYASQAGADETCRAQYDMNNCVMLSLLCSKYSGAFTDLCGELDSMRPLVICGPNNMSARAQKNVVEYLKNGGKVILLTTFPSLDENFEPCTLLRDYVGEMTFAPNDVITPATVVDGERYFRIDLKNKITKIPNRAKPFATDESGKEYFGFRKKCGKGEMTFLCGHWLMADFIQAEMLEGMLERSGAVPCVENSNRCVFSTLYRNGDKKGVFLLNLFTGKQTTKVKVFGGENAEDLGEIMLAPMEVKFFEVN